MTLRRLVRWLRLLAASLALSVALPTPATTPQDTVVWVAEAHTATSGIRQAPAKSRAPCVSPSVRFTLAGPTHAPRGSRTLVVQRRVYLRHASLLC